MCYEPITILNSKKHFNPRVDKMYYRAPCGKCGECATALRESFEARVWYEYLDTEKVGGYTFFQSFTYNQEHCPQLYGIYVFEPRHYRLFSENFRSYLIRHGYSTKDYKIIWVCEYGGEKFRPHYHALFFIKNKSITPQFLCEAQEYAWSEFEMKRDGAGNCIRHSLGYLDTNNPDPVKRSTIESRIVNGQGALDYVAKYVCKDFDFWRMVNGQIEKQKGVTEYIGPSPDKLTTKDKNKFFPFHRQSQGLGISMKDVISYDELLDGTCKIPDKILGEKVVSLPQYIDRKLFYNYNPEDKCFRLNDRGIEMKNRRIKHNLYSVATDLRQIFYNVHSFITDKFYKKYSFIESPSDFKIEIMNLMKGRSFNDLARYVVIYKDTCDYFRDRPITTKLDDDILLYRHCDMSSAELSLTELRDSGSPEAKRKLDFYSSIQFRNRPEFENFEEVLTLFNDLNKFFCQGQQSLYYKRQVEKSRQKKLFHALYRYG